MIRIVLEELPRHRVVPAADGPARRVRSNLANGLKPLPIRVERLGTR